MEPLVTITLKEYEELKSREKPKEDCMLLKEIKRALEKAGLEENEVATCLNAPKQVMATQMIFEDINKPLYIKTQLKMSAVKIQFYYEQAIL